MPALVLAALAGTAHALSFAPWNVPALQLAALAVLLALAARQPSALRAARLGFAFGLGWFGIGISWVFISLHSHGDLPTWIAAPATAALASLLAAFPALAAGAAHRLSADPARRVLLAWPASWTLAEWLRGTVLTGLPWIASGYAHTDGPLAGYAPILGVYGICLIAALIAGAAVALATRACTGWAALPVALVPLVLLAGGQMLRTIEWTRPSGAAIQVKLVQGNIAQDLKFADGGVELSVNRYFALMPDAAGQHSDLVVLPESAFPVPLTDLPPEARQALQDFADRHHAALIFGTFIEEPGYQVYNSAVGLQPDRPAQRYSKRHLVPFGEFIPLGFRWFVDLMKMPIGDQQRGAPDQPPMQLAGQRIAVDICFEDLFGDEIISAWHDPAQQPTMLLNMSNLAWFDDSIALPQHLQASRMRALETGRPMLLATNTGVTAIIDPRGRVLAQLPHNTAASLRGQVSGYTGRTPYVRLGNGLVLLLAGALLVAAALGPRGAAARDRAT